MGLYLQKWNLSETALLIQVSTQADWLERFEEKKNPKCFFAVWVLISKAAFIWKNVVNPNFIKADKFEYLVVKKIPNVPKAHGIVFAKEGFIGKKSDNQVWTAKKSVCNESVF